MTKIEGGTLGEAILEVDLVREEMKAAGRPQEAELFYQLKQLIGEFNQYLSGGYLDPYYVTEKCDSIKYRVREIWETKFNK